MGELNGLITPGDYWLKLTMRYSRAADEIFAYDAFGEGTQRPDC